MMTVWKFAWVDREGEEHEGQCEARTWQQAMLRAQAMIEEAGTRRREYTVTVCEPVGK